MKRRVLMCILFLIVVFTSKVYATETIGRAEDLGGPITISAENETDYSYSSSDYGWGDHIANKTTVTITAKIADNIKAVIKLELESRLRVDGLDFADDFDINNFVDAAYIEIRNIGGKPIAFVVGKTEIAFGQNHTDMPVSSRSPLDDLTKVEKVFGFTISLSDTGFFDLVEVSGFETGEGDLSIGVIDGASIRLTKEMTNKIKVQASYVYSGNGNDRGEQRASIGFIYESGDWSAWAEGVLMDGNELHPDSRFAVTAGVSRSAGPGKIVVEISYIQDSLIAYGIGYKWEVSRNIEFGPEVRYVNYQDGRDDDTQFAVRVTLKFEN